MSVANYLSITAIAISIVSLLVAHRSAHFGRAVKLAELRAVVLVKLSEASARIAHAAEVKSEMLAFAEQTKDFERFKRISAFEAEQLHVKASGAYKKLASMPTSVAVRIYEELFHEVCELNDLTIGYERNLLELRNAYVQGS